jgi:hypothetical protein
MLQINQEWVQGKEKKKIVCPETEAKVGEKQRAKEARACTTAWVSEWVRLQPASK